MQRIIEVVGSFIGIEVAAVNAKINLQLSNSSAIVLLLQGSSEYNRR